MGTSDSLACLFHRDATSARVRRSELVWRQYIESVSREREFNFAGPPREIYRLVP